MRLRLLSIFSKFASIILLFEKALEQYFVYILPGLFGVFLLIQLYYLLFVYNRLRKYKAVDLSEDFNYPPLSVIICARNEEANLKLYLSEILEQDYPVYEVIVVNDCSNDDTAWILKEFQTRYRHLRVVDITENTRFRQGKKFAVTLGVKAAQYEHLVLTDADCFPQSNQWLRHMAQQFTEGIEIVLGYSPYTRVKGFLNKYIRFETFQTALHYFSFALKRNAYMGVGRNLAYKKSLFFKGKGFASHMHIPSGDDDLFVNQNATKRNVAICVHADAIVWSNPKTSYQSYRRQKRRHFGAGKAYKAKHKRALTTHMFSVFMFYLLLVLLLVVQPNFWYVALGGYFLRLALQFLIWVPVMRRLKVADLLAWIPLMDIFYFVYTSFMGLLSSSRKEKVQWK